MKGKIAIPLALAAATAFSLNAPKASADSLSLKLFPSTFDRTILADSDVPSSELKVPLSEKLPEQLANSSIDELAQGGSLGLYLPLLSIGITNDEMNNLLPIIPSPVKGITSPISNETENLTFVASGELISQSANEGELGYTAGIEMDLTFPAINSRYSFNFDGTNNPLYFVIGVNQKGELKTNGLENKTFSETFSNSILSSEDNSLFADIYIVANSEAGTYAILRGGANEILSSSGESPNGHISLTIKDPYSLFHFLELKPYTSLNVRIPFNGSATNASAQIGAQIANAIDLAAETDYNSTTGWKNYLILKADLKQ